MSEKSESVNLKARYSRRLKLLVAPVAGLYLLISALLILCLVHPHGHSHSDVDGHFHFVCVWVQKAASSHAPSGRFILPMAGTALFVLLSCSWLLPLIRVVQLPGRSPPNLPSFA